MGFQEDKREIRKFVTVFVRTGASGLSQSRNTPQDEIHGTQLTRSHSWEQTCPEGGIRGGPHFSEVLLLVRREKLRGSLFLYLLNLQCH